MLTPTGHSEGSNLTNATLQKQDSSGSNLEPSALVLGILLESQTSIFVLFNFLCSLYALAALAVKELFFGNLSMFESHKLTERAIKYISFKVVFVGAYVTPDVLSITGWFAWFALLGFVKMFVGLCKDRFECLMSSPSATAISHTRIFALLMVLLNGTLWWSWVFCTSFWTGGTSELALLMFECALIVVDSLQTLIRHTVHLLELWRQSKADSVGSAHEGLGVHASCEWQGTVLYYTELVADVLALTLTLCHYCHVWYLHGLAFQLIDGILFLNIRAVALSLRNRFGAFLRYLAATRNVCSIFPDADPGQLASTGEDCAICREPMSAAKVLPCGHIFHLHCLRAWLQQSGSDNFTCPICRAPLFLKEFGDQRGSEDSGEHGDGPWDEGGRQWAAHGHRRPGGVAGMLRAVLGLVAASSPEELERELQDLQWAAEAQHLMVLDLEEMAMRHRGFGDDPEGLTVLTSTSQSSSGGTASTDTFPDLSDQADASPGLSDDDNILQSPQMSRMQGLSETLSRAMAEARRSLSMRQAAIDEEAELRDEASSDVASSAASAHQWRDWGPLEAPRRSPRRRPAAVEPPSDGEESSGAARSPQGRPRQQQPSLRPGLRRRSARIAQRSQGSARGAAGGAGSSH